jgi:transposase-like protein
MNMHKNARLTFVRRLEMVRDIVESDLSIANAADHNGVSVPTARKWLRRLLAVGEAGLQDHPSRPTVSPRAIDPKKALTIVELRCKRLDIKNLGRIERMSHRFAGNRRDTVEGAGWEFLFVAVDDHARLRFTELYPNERQDSAIRFLEHTIDYFRSLGIRVQAVPIDRRPTARPNASSSRRFASGCPPLALPLASAWPSSGCPGLTRIGPARQRS